MMVLLHRKVLRWRFFFAVTLFIIFLLFVFTFVEFALFLSKPDSTDAYEAVKHRQQIEHRLCVIIPYRDRWKELVQMLPRLHDFLTTCQGITTARYIVVNQHNDDQLRFNRATLINIGAVQAERVGCDYMAIHDVDIVPLNPNLSYHYPDGHIMHVAAGKYHPIRRYDYKNFIGSVLVITLDDFKKVNGMSNEFWGWGLEDDDFYLRLKEAGMAKKIRRPSNLSTGRNNTFLHLHGRNRRRDYSLVEYRIKRKRKRNKLSGLRNVNYTLVRASSHTVGLEHIELSVFDVHLYCAPIYATECQVNAINKHIF